MYKRMKATYQGKPRVKVSEKEKRKKDFEWAKKWMDYISSSHPFEGTEKRYRESIQEMYDFYYNNISSDHFEQITDPLRGFEDSETDIDYSDKFPAKFKSFSIISDPSQKLVSEYRTRPLTFNVQVHNPDVPNKRLEKRGEFVLEALHEVFERKLEGQEVPEEEYQKKIEKFDNEYQDLRAYRVQKKLDYIIMHKKVKHILGQAFEAYYVCGIPITYKGIQDDEIVYEFVNPKYALFDDSAESIQDGDYFARYLGRNGQGLSLGEIIDMFGDDLTKDEWEKIEQHMGRTTNFEIGRDVLREFADTHTQLYDAMHFTWKAAKKIGILTYTDPLTGEEEQTEVSEEYKPKAGESIEWMWVTEVWEGYRIFDDIYKKIQPIEVQRSSAALRSSSKLPYNGFIYGSVNQSDYPHSMLKLLIPYQVLYIIIMFMMELALGKYRGSTLLLDKGAIPYGDNWNEERFLYMMKAFGVALVDRNQPGADKSFNQYTTLQDSTMQDIAQLVQILDYLESRAKTIVGMSDSRLGQMTSSAQSGAVKAQQHESAMISEHFMLLFDKFVQEELNGLAELSKFVYDDDSDKGMFFQDDMAAYEGDFLDDLLADTGIVVGEHGAERDTLDRLKGLTQAFAQNGYSPDTILEVLHTSNITELRRELKKASEEQKEREDKQGQAQQKAEQEKAQASIQLAQMQHQFDMALEQLKIQGQKEIEIVKAEAERDQIPTTDEATALAEGRKQNLEELKAVSDAELKKIELEIKAKEAALKAKTEKYKADTSLKIAKENKNKYDV